MRPPASKKAAMTLAHSSMSNGSPPTLNVIQVPSPTIGKASRVEGMSRRAGEPSWACREVGKSAAAAVAKEARTNVRRVVRIRCSIIVAVKFLPMRRVRGALLPTLAVRRTAPATAQHLLEGTTR